MKKLVYILLILSLLVMPGCSMNTINPNTGQTDLAEQQALLKAKGVFAPVKDESHSADINFSNGWRFNDSNDKFVVEAGSLKADPQQGVLLVKNFKPSTDDLISEMKFLTVEKHGMVKIVLVNSFDLTIEATDHTKALFNVYNGFVNY